MELMITHKGKAIICLAIFLVMFAVIWHLSGTGIMCARDWMRIILLEVPLQLGIHYWTNKPKEKC